MFHRRASILFIALVITATVTAQQTPRPWVMVSVPTTAADDTRSAILATVIADNLELTLRLIGRYEIRPRPTARTTPLDTTEAAALAEAERLDYLVFGRVFERADGATVFSLSVYSRREEQISLEREAVALSLFDTFTVADTLAAELLGAFTGQRIAYGTVALRNISDPGGRYQVSLDGEVVGRNLTEIERVLVGTRRVEIIALEGPGAGYVTASALVQVREQEREEVAFMFPAPVAPVVPEEEPPVAVAPAEELPPPEPEIPLEWRVYPWRRWEREGETVRGAAVLGGVENVRNRDGNTDTPEFLTRLQLQWDHGFRHRLLLGTETFGNSFNDSHTNNFNTPDLLAENLEYGYVEHARRIYAGYGWRLAPLSFVRMIPTLRLGIEQEARLVSYTDQTGSTVPLPQNPGSSTEDSDPTGALFWNMTPAAELATEFYLRRFSLQLTFGALAALPLGTDYETTINGVDRDTGEPLTFVVAGSRAASLGWYALIGAGYSWGGDEERVNTAHPEREPSRVYPPDERRRWGLALIPSITMGRLLAPGYEEGGLFSVGGGGGIALQLTNPSGYLLRIGIATSTGGDRFVSRLYQRESDPTVRENTGIDTGDGFRFPVVALGRRLSLGPSLLLRMEYRVARHQKYIELDEVDGSTDIEGMEYFQMGPHLALGHALPGSGALVYGGLQLYTPLPTGSTAYSAGEAAYWFGEAISFTPDGNSFMVSELTAEFGIVFRLAGTPQRMLAAEVQDGEWMRYSRDGRNASEESTTGASGPATEIEARWWVPRISTGLGVEYIIADGEQAIRHGPTMILPVVLRFPFGLEFGVQSSLPLGARGVSGGVREKTVVGDINPDTGSRLEAADRLNRIFTADLGYRFRRDHRLSFRPGIRYVRLDDELWSIRTILDDGTVLATDEGRFAHAGVKELTGFAADVSYALSDRLVLRAVGALLPFTRYQKVEVKPALAPTVEHRLTNALGSFGILLTLEW